MRISKHVQARRVAMTNFRSAVYRLAEEGHDLTDQEFCTVLSDVLNSMLNRMTTSQLKEEDPHVP